MTYLFTDKALKKVSSFFFRVVLTIYGICILLTNVNWFSWYVYVISFIAFFFVFFYTSNKAGIWSKARLLNDFLFIGLILYHKPTNDLVNVIFLFLPIFNAPNHTGDKRSFLLYLLTIVLVIVLNGWGFEKWVFLPVLSLSFLLFFEGLRFRLNRINSALIEIIDELDISMFEFGNTHKIYPKIIERVNQSKIGKVTTLNDIICFIVKNEKPIYYNSSQFIYEHNFSLSDSDLQKLKTNQPVSDVSIEINQISSNKNFVISITIPYRINEENHERQFIYIITYLDKKSIIFTFFKSFIFNFLRPIFSRISKIVFSEIELSDTREAGLKRIKDRLVYVNNVIMSMHFIRNKLNPLKNFVAMSSNSEKINIDKVDKWKEIVNKELRFSGVTIKEIEDRTNYILENPNNPFKVKTLTAVSGKKIFYLIRKTWMNYFQELDLNFNLSLEQISNINVKLNEEAFDIILNDITSNIYKYSDKVRRVNFFLQDNILGVEYVNDFNSSNTRLLEETKEIVEKFNTREYSYIQRKTNGLRIVRDFLEQMDINYETQVLQDKYFSFKLYIKIEQ